MGVIVARSSEFKPVPKLMEWRGAPEEWCPRLVRGGHPGLFWGQGPRRIGLCGNKGVVRYGWFVGLGVVVVSLPCSTRVLSAGLSVW